jgi:NET1-associated nuclear protein 1 (U3 small nucleolar RNA-associated protein 17)
MVISTSELAPKTMIAGLQSRILPKFPMEQATVESLASKNLVTPAVEHKFSPGRILLAVPVSQEGESHNKLPPLPFLQTYDTSMNRHISRQALARNNVTNFATNPNRTKIKEADVILMQLSCDGRWLATVEEWIPPAADISYLVYDKYSKKEERMSRRETYLKFWHWNNDKKSWRLECRIDSPHQSDIIGSENRTLDLKPDPANIGFATVGEDGIMRVWRPKTRLRDGRVLRGVSKDGLTTWVCTQMINLGRIMSTFEMDDDIPIKDTPERAKLAFSDDGSVLAVSQDTTYNVPRGLVHFIATRTGTIQASQALMYTGDIISMLFLDRYLVVLSTRAVHVWNMVTNVLAYAFPLPTTSSIPEPLIPSPLAPALSHLSASPTHTRFLVVIPATDAAGAVRAGATVLVFDPASAQPCLHAALPAPVTAVVPLAAPAGGGFALLDAAGELRVVRPRGAVVVDPVRLAAALEDAQGEASGADEVGEMGVEVGEGEIGRDEEEVAGLPDAEDDASDGESEVDGDEDGRPLVRAEKLAEIFERAPAFALPPVQDLFDSVVRLYVGRKDVGGSEK